MMINIPETDKYLVLLRKKQVLSKYVNNYLIYKSQIYTEQRIRLQAQELNNDCVHARNAESSQNRSNISSADSTYVSAN